jgi:ABC-type lipoprotein export system ATPase subunit
MILQLEQVLPHPIGEEQVKSSGIWKTSCQFSGAGLHLVLAPSGKGKSTFLHILYGIRKDYVGDVSIDNRPIQAFTPEDWARIRQEQLSIVFQDLRLFPQLTAWENIEIKNSLTGHKTPSEIEEMLVFLGLEKQRNQPAETLSYGQRQRVAIIRALCQPFRFLFLDEPFSHLDPENIGRCTQLIETELKQQQGSAAILVSLAESYNLNFKSVKTL